MLRLLALVLASALTGCVAPSVPNAQPAGSCAAPSPRGELDAARLMQHVHVLAADSLEGRAAGTPGGAKARAYVLRAFREAGLAPVEAPVPLRNGGTGVNVLATVEGTDPAAGWLAITAHYDHVGVQGGQVYNGADDNASGVAVLIELARHFRANAPRHTLVFAALDAEEIGLVGAEAFVDALPLPREALRANVNMDMVSRGDGGALWAAGGTRHPALQALLEPVAVRAPACLQFGHDGGDGRRDWTLLSDHAPFHRAGVPWVYFGVEDHADYHQPTDDAERIAPAFFAAAAETVLDAVRALDAGLE